MAFINSPMIMSNSIQFSRWIKTQVGDIYKKKTFPIKYIATILIFYGGTRSKENNKNEWLGVPNGVSQETYSKLIYLVDFFAILSEKNKCAMFGWEKSNSLLEEKVVMSFQQSQYIEINKIVKSYWYSKYFSTKKNMKKLNY